MLAPVQGELPWACVDDSVTAAESAPPLLQVVSLGRLLEQQTVVSTLLDGLVHEAGAMAVVCR